MSTDPPDDPQQSAIEQLEQFGLSTYAARTFVALLSLGFGTARGVSRVSEVPRTRVYGAVDELRDRGLVDVRESSPKQFYAVSPETATRTFEREYQHRRATLRSALAELEPTERRAEQRGVWTVDGRAAVTERVLEFFGDADEEIVYVTVQDLNLPLVGPPGVGGELVFEPRMDFDAAGDAAVVWLALPHHPIDS